MFKGICPKYQSVRSIVTTHGALTYFLHRELVGAGPDATYRDVFDAARRQVTAAYPTQQPQMEGAAVMGLSLAKYGEITLKDGRVQQGNFNDFQIARIDESPRETRVHIVENPIDVHPSGVGEPGVPPFAPALCNAIFAATGKRIRSLPIDAALLKA